IEKELKNAHDLGALLFLDLDNFKEINDTKGHLFGNQVLQYVGKILRRNIHSDDCAARIGGDEFIAFLSNIHSIDEAAECAERICNEISQTPFDEIWLSCSIGVAIYPTEGTEYIDLVDNADKKLYQAKAHGKNQFSI
ncbi:PAS/PAC sensor-containing diguanylate cyclase, partial [gut metagenome]